MVLATDAGLEGGGTQGEGPFEGRPAAGAEVGFPFVVEVEGVVEVKAGGVDGGLVGPLIAGPVLGEADQCVVVIDAGVGNCRTGSGLPPVLL
ncbi:hypothetical protein A3850_005625 [Lewinella sp. 4G2]|nr:hypothetical protein A3850_005625 [Lewinella sp. 4G2]